MTKRILHVISGIPPDTSGTGRLLAHLISKKSSLVDWHLRYYYPRRPRPVGSRRQMIREGQFLTIVAVCIDSLRVTISSLLFRIRLRWMSIFTSGAILIFHPQTLGFQRTLHLLRVWRGHAFLFGLDNSFFCVRSYNHVMGEVQPCLRCLGGRYEAAKEIECLPFPVPDNAAFNFVRDMEKILCEREVTVLIQNERNAELYRRHIGDKVNVAVVGLWTSDLTGLFEGTSMKSPERGFDVVYHGHYVAAKGADWMLDVARYLPQKRFLFPTSLPAYVKDAPVNITFKPMTWESGLDEEIAIARIVCVPSLWSATIESALIKSIVLGHATARVQVISAYGDELPDGLVLNLDPDPATAARQLNDALEIGWTPDAVLYETWKSSFLEENIDLLNKLLSVIERSMEKAFTHKSLPNRQSIEPRPVSDHGLSLEKLGTAYGGWTVPIERIKSDWTCYCIGAGEDISFDCALIDRFDCNVFVFDPTPRAIEHVTELKRKVENKQSMSVNNNPDVLYKLPIEKLSKLNFKPYGIWSENTTQRFYTPKDSTHVSHSILNLQHTDDYFEAECRTLSSIMQKYGHNQIDLLKLDVEGAEYEIIRSMLADEIAPRVLCIEFDEGNLPLDNNAPERISQIIIMLQNAGFVFVHQDGWNTLFIHGSELQ